jgi:hypothetical protein
MISNTRISRSARNDTTGDETLKSTALRPGRGSTASSGLRGFLIHEGCQGPDGGEGSSGFLNTLDLDSVFIFHSYGEKDDIDGIQSQALIEEWGVVIYICRSNTPRGQDIDQFFLKAVSNRSSYLP